MLKYRKWVTVRRIKTVLTCLWLLAFITFFIPLPTKSNFIYYQYSEAEVICGLYWEYPWFCIITAVYIPMLSGCVLLFTSLRISRQVIAFHKKRLQHGTTIRFTKHRDMNGSTHHSGYSTGLLNGTCTVERISSVCLEGQSEAETDGTTENSDSSFPLRRNVNLNSFRAHQRKIRLKKVQTRDLKAVKVLMFTATVYFIVWGPYVVIVVLMSFFPDITIPKEMRFAFMWLANSNSFMNVFIYSLMYAEFRKSAAGLFRTFFLCVFKCRHPRKES